MEGEERRGEKKSGEGRRRVERSGVECRGELDRIQDSRRRYLALRHTYFHLLSRALRQGPWPWQCCLCSPWSLRTTSSAPFQDSNQKRKLIVMERGEMYSIDLQNVKV